MSDRDRDAAGRAHNARPRDGLGRPLPHGAPGEPTMPEDLDVDPAEGVQLAQQLLDEGRPFHAHEVFEALWKATDVPRERELWQGMAQLAVGLTHHARGNTAGAASLVQRGRDRVAGVRHDDLIDVPGVVAWADAWLAGRRSEPLRVDGGAGPAP